MKSQYSRRIRKVAILGSGVMGSGLACHMANAGFEVLLLDIVPFDLTEEERSMKHKRNQLVNNNLKQALKSKPAALYTKDLATHIKTGNFEDDFAKIADCDWVLEAVIERLDIKRQIFEQVDKYRSEGAIVSSNTSGIPIASMAEGRSADFKKNFLGTHFFNPPRYMRLLEIVPTKDTDRGLIDFFMQFGDRILGKTTVLCKDTPGFIANRIGVYAMAKIYELSASIGLSPTEVDKLTGPAIGRPKTGTFRLGDLVGLDVAVKVIEGLKANCKDDAMIQSLEMPDFMQFLIENKYFGNKTKKGFYERTREKDAKGRRIILELDLKDLTYHPTQKPNVPSLVLAKQISDLEIRIRALYKEKDKGGQLLRAHFNSLFAYVSTKIPEITDNIYNIDEALKAGFNWKYGPFEYWDILGVNNTIGDIEQSGYTVADWVKEMIAEGHDSFYIYKKGVKYFYDVPTKSYQPIPGQDAFVILKHLPSKPVFQNEGLTLHDLGEGVLCAEFTSPNNTIGEEVLLGLEESISIAEEQGWAGLVIGNNAEQFSVGANLMLVGMMAYQKDFEQLDKAVRLFQNFNMRCRYAPIPVVAAVQGYTFGGGCEMLMHCDKTVAAAESYIGLVEVGVGLLPGGGGTKEFALRISESFHKEDTMIPVLIEGFKTIGMGQVATSGYEAYDMGYLRKDKDRVVLNASRNIGEAKKEVLHLAPYYVAPRPKKVFVTGKTGLGALYVAINELYRGNYASAHDIKIAKKIANVLCGGDLSGGQQVSEQYLLDLEREAFLSLCGEPKTLERIQYMLENKKPLRN